MKKHFYLILVGLVTIATTLSFVGIPNKEEEDTGTQVISEKELAYAEISNATHFNNDSAKIKEKATELNNEIVKINEELNALEEEVEIVHEKTQASYYHDKFNGRKTASGAVFSNKKYTAAHKTLPFGTKVRVTNLSNDESIIVEINDRGPFSKGRHLDLSKKAFMELTHHKAKGTLNVKIEALPDNYEELKEDLQDELAIITEVPDTLDLNEFSL